MSAGALVEGAEAALFSLKQLAFSKRESSEGVTDTYFVFAGGKVEKLPLAAPFADALRGKTLTCWPSIAIDVKNAGGLYVDKPVVEDGNLITSRKPDDVPVFSEAIIRALSRVAV